MQHGVVLNIGMVANGDAVDVAPEHGIAPNAGVILQGHIAQNDSSPGDIDSLAERWFLAQKLAELLVDRIHGWILAHLGLGFQWRGAARLVLVTVEAREE